MKRRSSSKNKFRNYWIRQTLIIVGVFLGGFVLVVLLSANLRDKLLAWVSGEKPPAPTVMEEGTRYLDAAAPITLEAVLQAHYAATGGYDRQIGLHSLRVSGEVEQDGRNFDILIYKRAPNLVQVVTTNTNFRTVMSYDGRETWRIPMGQKDPIVIKPEDSIDFIRDAPINSVLFHYKSSNVTLRLVGQELFQKTDCFVIEALWPDGLQASYYLDGTTFLEKRILLQRDVNGRTTRSEQIIDAYEKVDGLMVQKIIRRVENDRILSLFRLKSAEFNVGLVPGLFQKPHGS